MEKRDYNRIHDFIRKKKKGHCCVEKEIKLDKLISLKDFVLQYNPSRKQIHNYALFLNRELRLSDFIECDLDGNIISEKENNFIRKELEEYAEAEKRVLFEGFSIVGEKHVGNKYNVFGIGFKNGNYKIVEDLINRMNSDQDILLTESAKKQILGL